MVFGNYKKIDQIEDSMEETHCHERLSVDGETNTSVLMMSRREEELFEKYYEKLERMFGDPSTVLKGSRDNAMLRRALFRYLCEWEYKRSGSDGILATMENHWPLGRTDGTIVDKIVLSRDIICPRSSGDKNEEGPASEPVPEVLAPKITPKDEPKQEPDNHLVAVFCNKKTGERVVTWDCPDVSLLGLYDAVDGKTFLGWVFPSKGHDYPMFYSTEAWTCSYYHKSEKDGCPHSGKVEKK